MGVVSEIVVPLPPDLAPATGGAATQGQAYSLTMPAVATDAMTVTSADGQVFTARPTELVYSGKDATGVRAYDYYVGSAPSTVTTNGRQARYGRVFPKADDVYVAGREGVKHFTVMQAAPRLPADYLVSDVEFGVSSLIGGVPLVPGRHERIDEWGFTLPRPFATDLAGAKVYGEYEVVDSDVGQQLFVWFPAAWFADSERVYPVTIDPTVGTSTYTAATGASNQHNIVTFPSNGVRLAALNNFNTNLLAYVSSDNGTTWVAPTAGAVMYTGGMNGASIALDPSENVMVAMTIGPNISVGRGVPTSAARTGFTWAASIATGSGYSDIVIAAVQDGTGWKAGVLRTFDGTTTSDAMFRRITITAGGTMTADATDTSLSGTTLGNLLRPAMIAEANGTLHATYTWPSSVQYKSAPFAAGNWTWGAAETVEPTVAAALLSEALDSTPRPVVAYKLASTGLLKVKRRATGGGWAVVGALPAITPASLGVACYGTDIIQWFTDGAGLKYIRTINDVWGSVVVVDSDTTAAGVTVQPDTTGQASTVLYRTGSASPYTYKSARLAFNQPPQEPTITLGSAVFAASVGTSITIAHSDSDQMGAWTLKRVFGTTTQWWNNTTKAWDKTSEYFNAGSGMSVTIPATDNAGKWADGNVYQLYAATKDSFSAVGPYNATAVRANVGATPVVTITSAATSNSASYLVEWTCDRAQGAYQARVLDGVTQVWTSGKVSDTSARALSVTLATNAKTYTAEVTVWDQTTGGGVASTPTTKGVTTSFTAAPTPTANASANSTGGFIGVTWTTPAPTGLQPAVSYVDLYRREASGAFIRIATQLPASGTYPDYAVASGVLYGYKTSAVGTNATTSDSNVASASVTFTSGGLYLHDPLDPVGTAHFFPYREVNLNDTPKLVSGDFQFVGRTYPVTRFDAKAKTRDVKVRVAVVKGTTDRDALEAFLDSRTTLCLRDFRGRLVWGVLKDLPSNDELWGGWVELTFSAVDYSEVR